MDKSQFHHEDATGLGGAFAQTGSADYVPETEGPVRTTESLAYKGNKVFDVEHYGRFDLINRNVSSLERLLVNMTSQAVSQNDPKVHQLMHAVEMIRSVQSASTDAQAGINVEIDDLITKLDDLQVSAGQLASRAYQVKHKLR